MEESPKNREREDLILAALLHDIGKLVQRADDNPQRMTHQEFGSTWLREKGISGRISHLVERHHLLKKSHPRYSDLDARISRASLVLCQADWFSAQERPEKEFWGEEGEWRSDIPLLSIFSQIRLNSSDRREDIEEEILRYYPLEVIGEAIIFPQKDVKVTKQDYKRCLKDFEKDFLKIKNYLNEYNLLLLLEKHTSFIPSETRIVKGEPRSYPDVSLFDHLKLTAAIASAIDIYLEHNYPDRYRKNDLLEEEIQNKKDKKFLLVGGDFSGVQNFIYTISSKGALKTLRARSFFLEILTEHVISQFLHKTSLPRASVIYAGGGRFYLFAPNTPSVKDALSFIREKTNDWLYENFRGKIYLIVESAEMSGEELRPEREKIEKLPSQRSICDVWSDVSSAIAKAKNQKFKEKLCMILEPCEPESPFDRCSICQRDDISEDNLKPLHPDTPEERVCSFCRSLYFLGDEIVDMRFLGVCREENLAKNLCKEPLEIGSLEGKMWYVPLRKIPDVSEDKFELIYAVNTWDVPSYAENIVVPLLLGNYARKVEDLPEWVLKKEDNKIFHSTASFDKLASVARGADRIGVLRMDVDRLGKIFTAGLEPQKRSFSRLASLSRFLNLFFKYYLNLICAGKTGKLFECLDLSEKNPAKNGRNVSIVYSGGDDLFLVGAWDEAVEIAFDIQRAFYLYTCNNPDITLSAGVFVQHENFPLHFLADLSGRAENLAKEEGRNRIALFYNPDVEKKYAPQSEGKTSYKNFPRQVFTWEEAEKEVVDVVRLLKSFGKINEERNVLELGFSHTFLHRLFSIFEEWESEGVLYLPKMAYIYARVKEVMLKAKKNENSKNIAELERILMDSERIKNLRPSLIWIELLTRKEKE